MYNYSKEDRYFTMDILEKIPAVYVEIMWEMIENMDVEKDCVQLFNLKVSEKDSRVQIIEHRQGKPEYKNKIEFISEKPITAKIGVLSENDYSVMMFDYSEMIEEY